MQDMHIYRNVNLDAEDLSSDEDVLCEAKLKICFKPWQLLNAFLPNYDLLWTFTSFFSWLYRFSWGSIYFKFKCLFHFFSYLCRLFFMAICSIVFSFYLKRRALKKRTYSYQKFKYLDGFCSH